MIFDCRSAIPNERFSGELESKESAVHTHDNFMLPPAGHLKPETSRLLRPLAFRIARGTSRR